MYQVHETIFRFDHFFFLNYHLEYMFGSNLILTV
jgi:hypothetical protein